MPIDSHLSYLEKHAFCPQQIMQAPQAELALVVVIPCYDEPDLLECLSTLQACHSPGHASEVIVVMSASEKDEEATKTRILHQFEAAQAWASSNSTEMLQFHVLHFPDLPRKHAGVGLTRKIGMDEAVRRLHWADQPLAPIACLDADTRVDASYLQAITHFFLSNRKLEAASIAFRFEESNPLRQAAILRIELAHRCLVGALAWAGHPFAFHTFGGAMAVRARGYQAQMGMNRRKAGEDFDFLQKFIELGQLAQLEGTEVEFSSRVSHRKPNGIGKSVSNYLESPDLDYPVFALASYEVIKNVLESAQDWFGKTEAQILTELNELPSVFQAFLAEIKGEAAIMEVLRYTKDSKAFQKRFFRWFNSLRCFQFLRFASENGFPKTPLLQHANDLSKVVEPSQAEFLSLEDALNWSRSQDSF